MTSGETIIALLLGLIAWLLYHIAKQLSYISGKRLRLNIFNWQVNKPFPKSSRSLPKPEKEEKLPN